MLNFTYYTPTEVIFGKDTQKDVGKEVKKWGGKKALIVYGGGSVIKSGLLQTVKESLNSEGIGYDEIGGVKPNPRLSLAREGVKKAIASDSDFILAVGGGSAIDTAKAIAHGAANPGVDVWDIWTRKAELTKSMPIGVVLTISAAGSEMSDSAVLTNTEIGKKAGINTPFNRVKFAIMNPELTYTLPKYQLTCGIVDIMMHTLERYFAKTDYNQMTDEIAEGLLRTVAANGTIAYEDQTDYDAMSEIMWCGSLSHNDLTGLGRTKDFSVHKMGHELSAMFDVAHGASLSAIWGSWARFVCELDLNRFAHYGEKVWGIQIEDPKEAAIAAIEKTEQYFASLKMPISISELEIGVQPDEVLKDLGKRTTGNDTFKVGAFKELGAADVYEILKAANH